MFSRIIKVEEAYVFILSEYTYAILDLFYVLLALVLHTKLYIPSTLNIDLILWHTQLIVYAVKC